MKQIPEDFLKKLREIDILEVAEQYFNLAQMGSIHQTKCIHGGDNEPSLTFFPPTNTFYCFGCGAGKKPKTEGSDVISFVMWIDKCSFMEAVQKLASMKGWQVPKMGLSKADKEKLQIIEQTLKENRSYWESLQNKPEMIQYLHDRGITQEEIDKWRIGFVPEEQRSYYAGKISFALMNDWGQTVGFSYRKMDDSDGPKYINSPQSTIFNKGSILYGLNFVKRLIREKGYAVVGEGFGDTILGQKLGLPFVSIMGTSLTDQQINILKQYTNTVILWMDGDGGGIGATTRHAKALQKAGFVVKVINYLGKDPDDIFLQFIRNAQEHSQGKKEDLIEKIVHSEAILASQFEVNQILAQFESTVSELKMKTAQEIMPVLRAIPQDVERDIFFEQAARRLDVSVQTLKGE